MFVIKNPYLSYPRTPTTDTKLDRAISNICPSQR